MYVYGDLNNDDLEDAAIVYAIHDGIYPPPKNLHDASGIIYTLMAYSNDGNRYYYADKIELGFDINVPWEMDEGVKPSSLSIENQKIIITGTKDTGSGIPEPVTIHFVLKSNKLRQL